MKQHPGVAQLSLDELWDKVGPEGEAFSNRVLAIITWTIYLLIHHPIVSCFADLLLLFASNYLCHNRRFYYLCLYQVADSLD